MAQRTALTVRQVAILRWIGDGCPDGVMEEDENHGYRISVGALRSRGLATTKGHGKTWSAEITRAGREYLAMVDGPTPPPPRQPNVPASQLLLDEIISAGGSLTVPRTWGRGGGPDYERRAALAEQNGKVPAGKRLIVTRNGAQLHLELVDVLDGTPTHELPVPVPAKVSKYHPVVAEFKESDDRHEVSKAQVPRVLRLLQGLVVEAERRGFTVSTVPLHQGYMEGTPIWSGERDGHLKIDVNGTPVVLRIREDGVRTRSVHYWPADPRGGNDPVRSRHRAYEAGAKGTIRISMLAPSGRPNLQRSWGDSKRRSLEDELPAVLKAVETAAVEEKERLRLALEEEEGRRRDWQNAMDLATLRHTEHYRAQILEGQVGAWRRASAIREYCDGIETAHPNDAHALEWSTWARTFAGRLDPLEHELRVPAPQSRVSKDELIPFMDGWDPYRPGKRIPRHVLAAAIRDPVSHEQRPT